MLLPVRSQSLDFESPLLPQILQALIAILGLQQKHK